MGDVLQSLLLADTISRIESFVAVFIGVVVIGGAVAASYAGLAPVVHKMLEPDDWTGSGTTPVQVKIAPG